MAIFVYIIECKDKSFYTGITWNLEKRIFEHNQGLNISTKGKVPVRLVYWKKFQDRIEAAKAEKQIKVWTRFKKQNLIRAFNNKSVYTEERSDEVRE